MIRFLTVPVSLTLTLTPVFAGALYLDIVSPANNTEAKSMHALAVVHSTACLDPSKSIVTASAVDSADTLHRVPLHVVPLSTPGTFAVIGTLPQGAAIIDIAVTNPEYKNYQPHAFIRARGATLEWASVKRFFGTPASDPDVRAMFNKP
jgi:hypothetical protein